MLNAVSFSSTSTEEKRHTTDAVVVAGQRGDLLLHERVPDVRVVVVIAGEEQSTALREGDTRAACLHAQTQTQTDTIIPV